MSIYTIPQYHKELEKIIQSNLKKIEIGKINSNSRRYDLLGEFIQSPYDLIEETKLISLKLLHACKRVVS